MLRPFGPSLNDSKQLFVAPLSIKPSPPQVSIDCEFAVFSGFFHEFFSLLVFFFQPSFRRSRQLLFPCLAIYLHGRTETCDFVFFSLFQLESAFHKGFLIGGLLVGPRLHVLCMFSSNALHALPKQSRPTTAGTQSFMFPDFLAVSFQPGVPHHFSQASNFDHSRR